MLGLNGLSSSTQAVIELLPFITTHIRNSSCENLSNLGVSNSLYGLRGMNSNQPEVRELIRALYRKIDRGRDPLSGQMIGNCCYGLNSMNSDVIEVRLLLNTLSDRIRRSVLRPNAEVTSQTFGKNTGNFFSSGYFI